MIRSPKTRLLARAAVEHLEAVAKAFAMRLFLSSQAIHLLFLTLDLVFE